MRDRDVLAKGTKTGRMILKRKVSSPYSEGGGSCEWENERKEGLYRVPDVY